MTKPFFTKKIRVRFAETDGMAVVYHGRYFEYLEAARIALLDEIGLPYAKLVGMGYHLPVVEAKAKYIQSALFDDTLHIEMAKPKLKGPRLLLSYQVKRDGVLLMEGSTMHVFLKDGKAVRPLAEFVEALKRKEVE